jgi:hypothetical protein
MALLSTPWKPPGWVMSAFDKFGWQKAVLADETLTPQECRLALLICVKKTKRDGTSWALKLFELAAELPGRSGKGASVDWTRRQLNKLVKRGWLIELDRGGGGTGNRAWRRVALTEVGVADRKPRSADSVTPEYRLPNPVLQTPGFGGSDLRKPTPTGTWEITSECTVAQRDPSKGVAAPRAKNPDAQALGTIFNRYNRSGHAKPRNPAPGSSLHPRVQEQIEAARRNLDLAQQQASQGETA